MTAKRLYFNGNEIDRRPEHEIVGGNRPSGRTPAEEHHEQHRLLMGLTTRLSGHPQPVPLVRTTDGLESARSVCIGTATRPFVTSNLNHIYRELGFDSVPPAWTISVCGVDGVASAVLSEFVTRIKRAATQRHAAIAVRASSISEIKSRLASVEQSGVRPGRCVLFVLPNRDQLPSPEFFALLSALDAHRIPYRRAYATDSLDFSVPDQLPSLLLACGGRPHRTAWGAEGEPPWLLALDLGHPQRSANSVVVATLTSPVGTLVHAAKTVQRKDETIDRQSLERLLTSCAAAIDDRSDVGRGVLLLRDGRHFENEDGGAYTRFLGRTLSVIEYRKRWNPQIVGSGDAGGFVSDVVAAHVPGCTTMFLTTTIPRSPSALPDVAKVTWREEWNQLRLTHGEIARSIVSAAAAPGLGLHARHLPAPVYWADGIAGISESDLRFRGVPCAVV
ncbi:MAG: hypothetical protein KIS87_08730 [Phycisphaeraceae bacterium]|nr:hypothetical protein [Phycisphaeraceae bacterium]